MKKCPRCTEDVYRDAHIISGTAVPGPYGCASCGWSEDPRYDRSAGQSPAQRENPGFYVDQWGGHHPLDAIAERAAKVGIHREYVEAALSDSAEGEQD